MGEPTKKQLTDAIEVAWEQGKWSCVNDEFCTEDYPSRCQECRDQFLAAYEALSKIVGDTK